jgi:hypothetical protein
MTHSWPPPDDCMFRVGDALVFVPGEQFASPRVIIEEPIQDGITVYCDDIDCRAKRVVRILMVGLDFEIVDLVIPHESDDPLVIADGDFISRHWKSLPSRFEVTVRPTKDKVQGRVVYGPLPGWLAMLALEWWVDDGEGGLMRAAVTRT